MRKSERLSDLVKGRRVDVGGRERAGIDTALLRKRYHRFGEQAARPAADERRSAGSFTVRLPRFRITARAEHACPKHVHVRRRRVGGHFES